MPSLPEPRCPPIVQVGDEIVAYLLCWEQHEPDGSWHAWVTWIRYRAEVPFRHVVAVEPATCARCRGRMPTGRFPGGSSAPTCRSGRGHAARRFPAAGSEREAGPTLTRRSRELVRRRRRSGGGNCCSSAGGYWPDAVGNRPVALGNGPVVAGCCSCAAGYWPDAVGYWPGAVGYCSWVAGNCPVVAGCG